MREFTVDIGSLQLRSGTRLDAVQQRVTIYGDPALPAVLVPHALTGHSRVHEWWGTLVGEGKVLDPQRVQIVGINALGSCYGSTGPATVTDFSYVTVPDMVAAQKRALDKLGIGRLSLVIGASLGGMQALQWALDYPEAVQRAVLVGSHDHQTDMGIALNAIQRDVIALNPKAGIGIARKIAMLSYKSDALFKERHDRRADRNGRFRYDIEGYLTHQAEKFEARMDPRSYVALTEAMDSFDVRSHDGLRAGHGEPVEPRASLLFIGISSDWLFLPQDVRAAAQRFAAYGYTSTYREIVSNHGHDAFLAEPQKLEALLRDELHVVQSGNLTRI
jgi:homoserine O-acetyltransferase